MKLNQGFLLILIIFLQAVSSAGASLTTDLTSEDLLKRDRVIEEAIRVREFIGALPKEKKFLAQIDFFALELNFLIARLQFASRWNYRGPQMRDRIPYISDENGQRISGPVLVESAIELLIKEASKHLVEKNVTYGWFINFCARYVQLMDWAYFYFDPYNLHPYRKAIDQDGKEYSMSALSKTPINFMGEYGLRPRSNLNTILLRKNFVFDVNPLDGMSAYYYPQVVRSHAGIYLNLPVF